MKLEILRRMREKSLQEVRFEAQKSLEGMSEASREAMEMDAAAYANA